MVEGQAQGWIRTGAGVFFAGFLLSLAAQAAHAESCAPWPGEPSPLPQTSSPDDLLARWALLRVAELSQAAQELEPTHPGRAHRLWQRVLCLEPTSEPATSGLARVPLAQLHRPAIARGRAEPLPGDAFASLGETLAVPYTLANLTADARQKATRALAQAEDHLKNARFEEALATTAKGRAAIGLMGPGADATLTAQIETLGATAAIALGRDAEARSSFARALEAKPDLTLDPMRTPPKVRRAFDSVRQQRGQP